MKENARHGFWNGSLPPMGYRIVEAAEQPRHRTKKTLVGLIFPLAREVDDSSRPMGVRSIVASTSAAGIPTRDGGRWGCGAVHKVLTRTTYIGRHRLNTKVWKTPERKPDAEVVEISVPPIVAASDFEAAQHPWPGTDGAARRQQSDTTHWYSFGAERTELGGYRRDHPRALAQHVEKVRIMRSKSVLLRTLVAPATFVGSLIQFLSST